MNRRRRKTDAYVSRICSQPTFIDLFCGCGGFSLGLERAGFRCVAAIDSNEEAVATYRANFSKESLIIRKDIARFPPDKLAARICLNTVDVIVGGPPCQGFSNVRQVDAANHGRRVRRDKRRYLFRVFLDYVAAFRPGVFVMENVLGIQSAAKGKFLTLVQAEARRLGYRVQAQVEEAWEARGASEPSKAAFCRRAQRHSWLLSLRAFKVRAGRSSARTQRLNRKRPAREFHRRNRRVESTRLLLRGLA